MVGLIGAVLLAIAVCWSLFWKGWALWVAGNRKEKIWFIVLFLVNTIGILDIIYLYLRKSKGKTKKGRR